MINDTHLERWLGQREVAELSASMLDWYGPAIAVDGVPGEVWVHRGGDFSGHCDAGQECSGLDRGYDLMRRLKRAAQRASRSNQRAILHSGFSGLQDLLQKSSRHFARQELFFNWPSPGAGTQSAGVPVSQFINSAIAGTFPQPGSVPNAAPGGRACTNSVAGALAFANPTGTGLISYYNGSNIYYASTGFTAFGPMLLYDRLFDVQKTMSSIATEAVSGVLTRYTNTVANTADWAGGNFLFPEVSTTLAATAHNWTVCTYLDEGGAGSTLPTIAGRSGAVHDTFDLPSAGYNWFMPLATGDVGVSALTQMQCDASVAGAVGFVIGHPIAWCPALLTNWITDIENVPTSFQMVRIFDNACLTALYVPGFSGQLAFTGTVTVIQA